MVCLYHKLTPIHVPVKSLTGHCWSRAAPSPSVEALHERRTAWLSSKYWSTGSAISTAFRSTHAASCSGCHCHSASCTRRALSTQVLEDKFGMNFPKYLASPRALWSSVTSLGTGMSLVACTFSGSGLAPSLVKSSM